MLGGISAKLQETDKKGHKTIQCLTKGSNPLWEVDPGISFNWVSGFLIEINVIWGLTDSAKILCSR